MIDIKIPTIGESITEVTLLKWTKKEGEWVERDEVIAELESEKATFEVNAEKAGTLHQLAKEGDTLEIGSVVANINEDATKPVTVAIEQPVAKVEEKPTLPADAAPANFKATPVASAIIADKKVNPKEIVATGTGGKIRKQDVLEALTHPGKKAFPGEDLFSRNLRQEKMSSLRKTIARRLVEAKKYHRHAHYF